MKGRRKLLPRSKPEDLQYDPFFIFFLTAGQSATAEYSAPMGRAITGMWTILGTVFQHAAHKIPATGPEHPSLPPSSYRAPRNFEYIAA